MGQSQVIKIVSQPLSVNTYILFLEDTGEAVVIDPSFYSEKILKVLREEKLDCRAILLTHGHGYSVKSSLLPLRRRALELDVQLVLYGHTHLPALSEEEGVLFCNPGSCMGDRLYAEIELQDGKVADARLCRAEHRITRRMKPTWWKS